MSSLHTNRLSGALPTHWSTALTSLTHLYQETEFYPHPDLYLYHNFLSGALAARLPAAVSGACALSLGAWAADEHNCFDCAGFSDVALCTAAAANCSTLCEAFPYTNGSLFADDFAVFNHMIMPALFGDATGITAYAPGFAGIRYELGGAITRIYLGPGDTPPLPLGRGSLPTAINLLKEMDVLAIRSCILGGTFPSYDWDMPKLRFVYMQNNSIGGALPTTIARLSALVELNLALNRLVGPLPTELGALSLLENGLRLDHNLIDGTLPSELGALPMRELQLNHNRLSGTVPASWGNLTLLDFFNIHNNWLSGPIANRIPCVTGYYSTGCMLKSAYAPPDEFNCFDCTGFNESLRNLPAHCYGSTTCDWEDARCDDGCTPYSLAPTPAPVTPTAQPTLTHEPTASPVAAAAQQQTEDVPLALSQAEKTGFTLSMLTVLLPAAVAVFNFATKNKRKRD